MVDFAHAAETYWRTYTTSSQQAMLFTPPLGLQVATPETASRPAQVAPTLPVAAELSVPPSPRRRVPWLPVAGVGFAAAIAVLVFALASRSSEPAAAPPEVVIVPPPARPSPSERIDAAIAIAPPVDAPVPPQTHVHLVIESVPVGADVYRTLDGVRLGKTPLARDFERTNGEVELVLRLAGYRDARVTMSTAADATSRTALVRAVHRPPATPGSGSGGPTILDPYGGP
jgi:hypothetical protein